MDEIEYKIEPELSDRGLNDLFASAWENHAERRFGPVLLRSLTYLWNGKHSKRSKRPLR